MLIKLLGIFDIIVSLICMLSLNFSTFNLPLFFVFLLLFKGVYTFLMTMNLFDFFGLIDLLSAIIYLIALNVPSLQFFSRILLILLLLKGVSSFIKLG